MGLTAMGLRQRGFFFPFLFFLSPCSGFPCSRPQFGNKGGKNRWQDKEMQRLACVYIAKPGRQTNESKEATESYAFIAKTTKTAMITFSFFCQQRIRTRRINCTYP
jgi:hypothetical protein